MKNKLLLLAMIPVIFLAGCIHDKPTADKPSDASLLFCANEFGRCSYLNQTCFKEIDVFAGKICEVQDTLFKLTDNSTVKVRCIADSCFEVR